MDIVSKNGNLLLNIPLRGDGTIDEDERRILSDLAAWMPANSEAIHGTRPFTVFGEGPPDVKGSTNFNENTSRPYTAEDIRFTVKGDALYAFALDGRSMARSRSRRFAGSPHYPKEIGRVELLAAGTAARLVVFARDPGGLVLTVPGPKPNDFVATLKILPK